MTKTIKENYWNSFRFRSMVLIVLGLLLYSNSIFNEYALDDGIVIEKNDYVQQGFGGIKKILSSDAYESFYKELNATQQLSGGRYRPLSIVTFAIEQQFFGSKEKTKPPADVATVRHFVNVVLYLLSVVALFYLLFQYVFNQNKELAFLTAFIFLIHPIHTEVIANVKSRDEILSFLFIVLTFIKAFEYNHKKQNKQLIAALFFYFLALLSKEYAISLIVLVPMLLYLKNNLSIKESLYKTIPFFFVAFVYILIRFAVVGVGSSAGASDVLNNPYMFATVSEKWATKIFVLDKYLQLLFYPHPLSADYSYSSIPYMHFYNWQVILSIVVHIILIIAFFVLFKKRNMLAFALAFYLIHLLMVSNFIMDIGATMGERLVYHSSLGFAMCLAAGINFLINKTKNTNVVRVTTLLLLFLFAAQIVIPRNKIWKNDTTLFINDVQTVPNSALANGNAGKAYVDLSELPENKANEKELLQKAIYHLQKAISIHPKYVNGYINLGVCYLKLKNYDQAKQTWDKAYSLYPNNPYVLRNYKVLAIAYLQEALNVGVKNITQTIALLEKAVQLDSQNPDIWYNLGGASYTAKNYTRAKEAWEKTLQLKPDYDLAKKGLAAIPKG